MKIHTTGIEGCYLIEPVLFRDDRGVFMQVFHRREFETAIGQPLDFVQDNQSVSRKNVLRGLHFQKGDYAQAKLVQVVRGRALDVVVDLRRGSPSFGRHFSTELSAANHRLLFIPRGLAHGFLAREDQTVLSYKCDAYYRPDSEGGIIYDDPHLGINWDIDPSEVILSEKDRQLPRFKDIFQ